jgi:hypothetical protein
MTINIHNITDIHTSCEEITAGCGTFTRDVYINGLDGEKVHLVLFANGRTGNPSKCLEITTHDNDTQAFRASYSHHKVERVEA